MKLSRLLPALVCGFAMSLFASWSAAQTPVYPTRQVTFIVPYPAGSTDTFARLLAGRLAKLWGQPVIVDNKPGASGVVGMTLGRQAPPDGYTLLLGMSGPLAANPHLISKLPYDSLTDFTHVSGLLSIPLMIAAHPSAPYSTVKELVEAAKKNPGLIEYASPGNGTGSHLAAELFKLRSGINLLHVPYKGSAPALTDLLGGHTKLMITGVSELAPHVKAGRLKAIAVTGSTRVPQLPDVPSLAETYPGFEAVGWGGLLAPRDVPRNIVAIINADVKRVFSDPTFVTAMTEAGLVPDYREPAEFRKYLISEIETIGKVVKAASVRLD